MVVVAAVMSILVRIALPNFQEAVIQARLLLAVYGSKEHLKRVSYPDQERGVPTCQ